MKLILIKLVYDVAYYSNIFYYPMNWNYKIQYAWVDSHKFLSSWNFPSNMYFIITGNLFNKRHSIEKENLLMIYHKRKCHSIFLLRVAENF